MAYGEDAASASSGDSELNEPGRVDDGEAGEPDLESGDLPAFLTEDDPAIATCGPPPWTALRVCEIEGLISRSWS
jgi:hypothetical protein